MCQLEMRLKEHRDDCRKQNLQSSVVADHALTTHYPIKWEDTTTVDRARTRTSQGSLQIQNQ